jgi:hypothetical protein
LPKRDVTKGTWTGKLVDVQGFEGDVRLRLSGKGEALRGTFAASLLTQDDPVALRGTVSGKLVRGRIRLSFEAEEFSASFDAKLLDLAAGGEGACGTYEVSARGFSPLRGGIVVLNRGATGTDAEMKPEPVEVKP